MTLKELKNEYPSVIKHNGRYIVYGEGGKRSPHKYLATVIKRGSSMKVLSEDSNYLYTTKISELNNQIEHFTKSLPYDSEYYNPMFREGLKEDLIVRDYLDSIGFKYDGGYRGIEGFQLDSKSIYGYQVTKINITINGLDMFDLKDEINISLHTGDSSWVSVTCERKADEIIKNIDSLLKPLMITEAVSNIKIGDKMKMSDIDIKLKQIKNLDIEETDMKEYLKKELLNIINTL